MTDGTVIVEGDPDLSGGKEEVGTSDDDSSTKGVPVITASKRLYLQEKRIKKVGSFVFHGCFLPF